MAIDKTLVVRKINLIARDLKRLKPLSLLSFKDYQARFENEILAERYLERLIGRMIDINYHLITSLGHMPPKDYFESFTLLGELKILPFDLARKLANYAGLRNRLTHEYNGLDMEKVYRAIKECFKDLPEYLKRISKLVALKGLDI